MWLTEKLAPGDTSPKTGQLLINKCLYCQGQAIGSESIIFCYFLSQYAANSLFHVSFPMVHKYNINFTWVSLSSASWNCLAMRRRKRVTFTFTSYFILLTFFSCLLQNKYVGLYPGNKHPITVIYIVEQSQFNYIITLRNDVILYISIDINMNSNKKFCNKINMQHYEK